MNHFVLSLFTILLISLYIIPLEAQRTYRQSRVKNGTVVTDYYYENLPGEPRKGKPYREGGRIKYERRESIDPYAPTQKGRPYRDERGRIRYN